MKKRLTMVFAGMFLLIGTALAQTKITGTVVSGDDGEPIIGASVAVQGAAGAGAITDIDGHFTIEVPAGKKLVISYIGMTTQTVTPKPGMVITLTSDAQLVEEVVVTGMQKMDKRLFTGATTKIAADNTKLDGIADVSRGECAERVGYFRYSSENPRAWCHFNLRFVETAVGD